VKGDDDETTFDKETVVTDFSHALEYQIGLGGSKSNKVWLYNMFVVVAVLIIVYIPSM